MLVDLLIDTRVCMEASDPVAVTQKVTGYWNLLMQQMVVANTFFKKRDNRLGTYQSGNSRNQLDYVLVRKFNEDVKDVKLLQGKNVHHSTN